GARRRRLVRPAVPRRARPDAARGPGLGPGQARAARRAQERPLPGDAAGRPHDRARRRDGGGGRRRAGRVRPPRAAGHQTAAAPLAARDDVHRPPRRPGRRRAGGAVLRARYGRPGRITMKPHGAGPVSEADLASEAAILARLRTTPIPVLSEEAGGAGSGRRWIVDPLDGTGNFIRHLPWFGVGVALATDDAVELGVVYVPITDELFAAARGRGATLNGGRIRVSETGSLAQSCIVTSIDQGMCAVPANIRRFARVAARVAEMVSPNAALVDLAYVAAGRTDGFWEDGLAPWDMAAGSVLLEEAGGPASQVDGTPLRPRRPAIAAAN